MDVRGGSSSSGQTDPFTKFWTDCLAQMSGAPMGQSMSASHEATLKQMRQAFLDGWAKCCDEFLRSEQFLDLMKRSMDGALAFREQMNRFLSQALQTGPTPTRDDTDSILQALRSLEERVLDQLENLARRVEDLEANAGGARSATSRGPRRSKGSSR